MNPPGVSQRFRTGRQTPLIHIEKFRYSAGIYSRFQCFNVIRNCRDRLRQSRRYGSFSCSECDADFMISSETTLFQFRFRKISFFISREPASSSAPPVHGQLSFGSAVNGKIESLSMNPFSTTNLIRVNQPFSAELSHGPFSKRHARRRTAFEFGVIFFIQTPPPPD